jgi:hypothetical protein
LASIEAECVFGEEEMLTEDISKLTDPDIDKNKLGLNFGDLLKDEGI